MPGLVSHVVYAQKFVKQNHIQDPKNYFVIGSLIPDISYLGNINRSTTHIPLDNPDQALKLVNELVKVHHDLPIKDIELFKKGLLFHSFLDSWWSEKFPDSKDRFLGMALKLFEDQVLYPQIENFADLLYGLRHISDFFELESVPGPDFERCIQLYVIYLSYQPTTQAQLENFRKWQFITEEEKTIMADAFSKIAADTKNKCQEVLNLFDSIQTPHLLSEFD